MTAESMVLLTKKKFNIENKIYEKKIYNKAIVLGGSKGLGKSIANELKKSCKNVIPLSSKDIDISNIESVTNLLVSINQQIF